MAKPDASAAILRRFCTAWMLKVEVEVVVIDSPSAEESKE
jgi:hypothetical protein